MASSAVGKGRLGHSWPLPPWRQLFLVWPCDCVVLGTWVRDLPVCPTVRDLGWLGQVAGGIALVSDAPGFLLVNRLLCKPACCLGSSLVELHRRSLSLQHPLHTKVQDRSLSSLQSPKDWRPFLLCCPEWLSLRGWDAEERQQLQSGAVGKRLLSGDRPPKNCDCGCF